MTISKNTFGFLLGGLVILQILAGLWRIDAPFLDGRYHYNWGPPFWLLKAETLVEDGLAAHYWGLPDYNAHPQLIGPVIGVWTKNFGFSEKSIRSLALTLTIIATILFVLAANKFIGRRRALIFGLFLSALPLVYIYGRMINQEPLVFLFLALTLWGIGFFKDDEYKKAIPLVFFGSLGMALSDWSGYVLVFALAIASLAAWKWKEHKKRILRFTGVAFSGALLGLVLYFLQDTLQSGASVGKHVGAYIELWKYRAGQGQGISLGLWLKQNISFVTTNFAWPIFLIAFVSLGVLFRRFKKGKEDDSNLKQFALFTLFLGLGNLLYMALVPQASLIHIYYQYFLSIPVAFGLLYLYERICQRWNMKTRVSLATLLIFFLILAGYSYYQFNRLYELFAGDESDIALIKTIKDIPAEKTVVGAHVAADSISWFQNPNIEYYAGRAIPSYILGEGVPFADYQIVPAAIIAEYLAGVNNTGAYGGLYVAKSTKCSNEFCLVELFPR